MDGVGMIWQVTDDVIDCEDLDVVEISTNAEGAASQTGVKYAHLIKQLTIDKNASREDLIEQYNNLFKERMVMKKKIKVIKRKNMRTIEKMAKACENKKASMGSTSITEAEAKKKKSEPASKITPNTLAEVVMYLETQDLLTSRAISVIRALLGHSLNEPLVHDRKASKEEGEVSPLMKAFAKTLLFYSVEAYHMIKELYYLPMPTPSISRTWYNMGLGLPGWSSEAFLMLKDEVQKTEHTYLNTCVIMGEYDLFATSSCDETEIRGHIDYGTTGDLEVQNYSENLPLAQSALFFMLVPMDGKKKWKIPLAYFLIDTLSPEERANVLLECLWRVYNMGSMVVAVVIDASVSSRQTVESLGISFEELPSPNTAFPHPADGLVNVHVLFDPHSIVDLLRHTWASVGLMVDERGGAISWKYFTELVKVQETQAGSSEQLDQTATWYWDKSLMRKRLISQLFTEDVANSIECCGKSLQLPQFSGSESTVLFIRTITKLLQIFDCGPLNKEVTPEWKRTIVDCLNYLFVLRDRTGQGIFATNCKAPFVCFYMNLLTLLELVKKVPLNSIAELNMNGLELLILAIRCRLNWEDRPSAIKFANTYALLLQEEGLSLSDNIVRVESYWWLDSQDVANARKSGLEINRPVFKPENTPSLPQSLTFYPILLQNELQRFRASQLVLVHTVKRVADVLQCNQCIEGLQMSYVQDNPTLVLLRKTCGGFVYPSQGVVEVCVLADYHLKIGLRVASPDMKYDVFSRRENALIQSVCIAVLKSVLDRQRNLFPQLDNHLKVCARSSNHVCRLIKVLTASYVHLRLQSVRSWCSSQV
ncbi:uncharacterized protein LOC117649908 [Thrips palmi]|uniref:Uncharacterized protein LOC117649908 n=1 Tax=Thrips palmi TaxID=161013 RepID=A0A6P8ZUX3_THRPL|nr:uncharacterized protein LOC117649908 [Thrips palmi]